jgi:hypothetical protein
MMSEDFQSLLASMIDPNIAGRTPEGRTIVKNPDGTVSTEQTITVEMDGGFVNIPTMFRGKKFPDNEAIEIMRKNKMVDPDTGRKLSFYSKESDAIEAAKARSKGIYTGGRR